MKTSMRQRVWVWGCLLFTLLGPLTSFAQRIDTLIPFTGHTWRFNDTGTDLGTAWRTNDFDDTTWSSGSGLFGVETNLPFPYLPVFPQITTPMFLGPPLNLSTTFYFRTWLNLDASNFVPGALLISTNLIDDGAVIYVNGIEAGRFRMESNPTASTPGGFQQSEGTNEVILMDTNLFRIGTNLLAVEVHQNYFTSSDIVWGHTLVAFTSFPLAITNEPLSQSRPAYQPVTFSVGVSGAPATYFWQKEDPAGSGVWVTPNPVPQNLPTYTIPILQNSNAGNYHVVVSNIFGSLTSVVAQLTVVELPLVITNQPASQVKAVIESATFTVGVAGTPASYTWQKESPAGSRNWIIPSPAPQNLPIYSISPLQTTHSGNYRVLVSNTLSSVTSMVAQLTVFDTIGPRPLWAVPSSFGGKTNRIVIRFSELLNSTSATSTNNYSVNLLDTGEQVRILSMIYISSNAICNLDTTNWHVEGTNHYVVTISNLRDTIGNVIAPNSQVPVWWTNYVPSAETWSLPSEPDPSLALTDLGTNRYRMSWTGHGYALESTTNLPPPAGLPVFLAWPEVTNMSNPFLFTNDPVRPQRYFRLRK